MICELLKFQTYRFKNKQLQFINLNITVTCKRKNKMNPSLLIIGSLALNFHHYNIQSNQKGKSNNDDPLKQCFLVATALQVTSTHRPKNISSRLDCNFTG